MSAAEAVVEAASADPAGASDVVVPDVRGPWVTDRLYFAHSGEELPILRHWRTWVAAPLAFRYVLEDARHALGPGSLELHLRALSLAYRWAETDADLGNLEAHLMRGGLLTVEQFKALRQFLELAWDGDAVDTESAFAAHRRGTYDAEEPFGYCAPRTFNQRLLAVVRFLKWAVWPMNHGGARTRSEDEIELFLSRTERQVKLKAVAASVRPEPLTPHEIRLIRLAIGPDQFGRFRDDVFDVTTRLRNHAMFELAFNYGPRKAEMLTVRLAHLPAPHEGHRQDVAIPRQQDAPDDRRRGRRPRGKTVAREGVPPLDPGAFARIRRYLTTPFPVGRFSREVASPYLFVTDAGVEVSVSTADAVIAKIGGYAAGLAADDPAIPDAARAGVIRSLEDLAWHRVRHTWAEQTAYKLYRKHGAAGEAMSRRLLSAWGSWKDGSPVVSHYVQHAERRIQEQEADAYHHAYLEYPL